MLRSAVSEEVSERGAPSRNRINFCRWTTLEKKKNEQLDSGISCLQELEKQNQLETIIELSTVELSIIQEARDTYSVKVNGAAGCLFLRFVAFLYYLFLAVFFLLRLLP
jgi:phosphoglycerate-specific signal transduction histidine kinase